MSQKLLIDTDPGNDDATAITVALLDDAFELVGLTTVPGNTTATNVTRNALALLTLHDRMDVPVCKGCERPLCRELDDAEETHGPGGIRGELPDPASEPSDAHAAEFIVDQVHEHGNDLTIAAVGPMTNLALALHLEPDLPDLVGDIYLMGGSAWSGGNATPESEFNFYADPEAAKHVIRHGDTRMVGLDATQGATVPLEMIEDFIERPDPYPTIATWIAYASESEIRDGLDRRPSIHDAVVVLDIAYDILSWEEHYLDVGTSNDDFQGAISCDRRYYTDPEPNTLVATDVDRDRFRERLADALTSI